ncbi:aminodeoxychorismate synthase component I [Oryzifoliimicrobium ureilyticus]|uniref:aminodeoxychorismate synthase component I n=1 Tax=Oryzifoliimicrobium ureilyticus TaxID=3113724 RepID=UPI0030764CD0
MVNPPECQASGVNGVLFSDDVAGKRMLFTDPVEKIVAMKGADVVPALHRLDEVRRRGLWAAGYLSYEAGFVFEEKLAPLIENGRQTPLLSFGVFEAPQPDDHALALPGDRRNDDQFLSEPQALWSFKQYRQRFELLHRHLMQGDCYQANLTMPIRARWQGDPLAAFWALAKRQPVRYAAYVDLGGPIILSRSPELFFRTDEAGWIETKPMKGTARRGGTEEEDAAIITSMRDDPKTQAENRMIVDLLRNDMSLIAKTGTVEVPQLFAIETYPTLHQMVSTVQARLRNDLSIKDIFAALFPCGSITGTPKMSAMRILHRLERAPRNVYCGAIGMMSPTGAMRFSVAIRTISLFEDGHAVFNVGGGIVLDSTVEAEYAECLLKARFAIGDQTITTPTAEGTEPKC